MPANRVAPSVPVNIPTEGGDTPAEVPKASMAPDSGGPGQPTELEHSLPPPDLPPVQGSTPVPQDQGETSLVEEAQIRLDLADEAKKLIDQSNTWEGVVGRIKWLMDTLNPVAGVRVIFIFYVLD